MCGRYASFREDQALADEFAVATVADDARLLPPSWNIAPTDGVRMVVERADRETGEITRQLRVARWGLVPSWAKDPSVGARMINARAETVADKPAFARPLAARRALLPADGYYEWQVLAPPPADVLDLPALTGGEPTRSTGGPVVPGAGSGASAAGSATSGRARAASGRTSAPSGRGRRPAKQPYWIHPADGDLAALAGLYEFWRDPTKADDDPARWLVSVTVVTRAATQEMAAIHDRQPVVVPRDAWSTWLDPAVGADEARELLTLAPPSLTAVPVSPRVNAVANDDPTLIDPFDPRGA